MQNVITIEGVKALGVNSVSVKDGSPRGINTVSINEVKVGDYVVLNNSFYLVIEFSRDVDKFVEGKEVIKFSNKRGESVELWITSIKADKEYKNDLMNLWVKNNYCNFIERRLDIETFATDVKGNCYNWYNPSIKMSEDKKRLVINFDWILEDNESNRNKIIAEVVRLSNCDIEDYKNCIRSEV